MLKLKLKLINHLSHYHKFFAQLLGNNYFIIYFFLFNYILLRGRYDIKVFQNHLFFHGKTYDYKIPFKSVTRMFLLPHKDGRHMFFVLHINPPIRQGQTRYPFLVLEFSKEEHIEVDLGLTE